MCCWGSSAAPRVCGSASRRHSRRGAGPRRRSSVGSPRRAQHPATSLAASGRQRAGHRGVADEAIGHRRGALPRPADALRSRPRETPVRRRATPRARPAAGRSSRSRSLEAGTRRQGSLPRCARRFRSAPRSANCTRRSAIRPRPATAHSPANNARPSASTTARSACRSGSRRQWRSSESWAWGYIRIEFGRWTGFVRPLYTERLPEDALFPRTLPK